MRDHEDNVVARSTAESQLADLLINHTGLQDREAALAAVREVLGAFPAVEFESAVRKVGRQDVYLRRLVMTGSWEVAGREEARRPRGSGRPAPPGGKARATQEKGGPAPPP